MANWPGHHQQFASALKARLVELESVAKWAWDVGALKTLIDNLPYYGNREWTTCHRGTLSNLLQINFPNDGIGNPPSTTIGLEGSVTYFYRGPFSGYRDAFFHGVRQSPTAERLQNMVGARAEWDSLWKSYSVAVLTDAVSKTISVSINTSKLAEDLASYHKKLMPYLAASCLAVFDTGFTPTATPLNAIISAGNGPAAAALLSSEIRHGRFTAMVNHAIANGGDDAVAAVWFLFDLWTTLKALGAADVDAIIKQAQGAGLTVPNEVGPGNWWGGGYTGWFTPLSGSDLAKAVSGAISAAMQTDAVTAAGTFNNHGHEPKFFANGYALSFCIWGSLNAYKS